MAGAPGTTRLRWIRAKKPESIEAFLGALRFRVQIYGAPVWDGKYWTLWVVPPDDVDIDLKSQRLE